MDENFTKTSLNEQETIIIVSHGAKEVKVYTSRKEVCKRLMEKLGEPKNRYYLNKEISGVSWTIPFNDKQRLHCVFSKPIIIGYQ